MDLVTQHFPHLSSTNSYAKEHILEFERDKLTWLTVDEQSAGRGRFGRKWHSERGENLLGSFVFFIDQEQEDVLSLTHVLAIAVAQVLEYKGVASKIKWPNDVMVAGKKISGILCETVYLAPQFGVVIGLGFNVNMPPERLATVGQPATSLWVETGKQEVCESVGLEIASRFKALLELFLKEGFTPLLPTFRSWILPGKP